MTTSTGGFENLRVWQLSREMCRDVYPIVRCGARERDYPLSQQLNKSSLSVMANIAEGYLRRTHREFAPFVRIAAGSNGETRALLYAAVDRDHVAQQVADPLIALSNDIGRMLEGLLGTVQQDSCPRRRPR